ncbi:hypothetical protein [Nitrosomonas marina]|uniref:hypothetical protein n=1 Tax=Nitrosomonas marina TaxID=917 RepID=UPI0015A60261|nr:hypothetical protein [Nitrosomonas marina]
MSIAASSIAIVFYRGLETESFELAVSAADGLDNHAVFVAETGLLTIQHVNAFGTV